jgi:hypothetical protein
MREWGQRSTIHHDRGFLIESLPQAFKMLLPGARRFALIVSIRSQILNTPSMIISPDSKMVKGPTGSSVPGFPAMLPVPAGKSPKPTSPRLFALNPAVPQLS